MVNKIKNIIFILFFLFFIISISFFYFSEKNIRFINKSRSFSLTKINHNLQNIPLLENDTKNIILYSDGIEIYENKKKKYKFWSLIDE
jgi:uncharacterized protein YxeA